MAKSAAVAQTRLEINPYGAEARIILGCYNCYKLWRITLNQDHRSQITREVVLCSDGGLIPWNSMMCHLEETSLREHYSKNQEDKDYLLRVRNPNNPFCPADTEDTTYSKEQGKVVLLPIETPRTAFHYIKRSNRTSVHMKNPENVRIERTNNEAINILRQADPTLYLKRPTSRTLMSDHVKSMIVNIASDVDLTTEVLEEAQTK